MKESCGYSCVAFGERYLEGALRLANSIIAHSKYPLYILTNVYDYKKIIKPNKQIIIELVEWPDEVNRLARTKILYRTPFQKNLHLDADIQMLSSRADLIFKKLDNYNLGVIKYNLLYKERKERWSPENYEGNSGPKWIAEIVKFNGCFLPVDIYNAIILFRKDTCAQMFFDQWDVFRYRAIRAGLRNAARDIPNITCTVQCLKSKMRIYDIPASFSGDVITKDTYFYHESFNGKIL